MLYRISIKTKNGTFYYLTSSDDLPETDAEVSFEDIKFLSKINPTHAHTFSTEELAKKVIDSLPYPYNEKSFIIETPSKEHPVAFQVYYRIGRKTLGRLNYIKNDKTFTNKIEQQTARFSDLEDAKEFFNSLANFTKKTSFIIEVHDSGPPKYEFKNYFLTNTGEKIENI